MSTEGFPTQSVDGRAHLTMYDPGSRLSFVWSGSLADPIEVSAGGYGEPLADRFPATADPASIRALERATTPGETVAAFQRLCETYLAYVIRA